MLQQIVDLRAEADELRGLLLTMQPGDWQRPTLFKGWSVDDVVQHLHAGDLLAWASASDGAAFDALIAEVRARRERGMSRLEETRDRFGDLRGPALLEAWYALLLRLCEKLATLPSEARLKWAGPAMSLRMFTTARQMEIWAHGQEIWDLLGRERQASERLRNIAEIGVRTFGWTFTNRGQPAPGAVPTVVLRSPAGATWSWHSAASADFVAGEALDFCQVVTQVRNIADTALVVRGAVASRWMGLAQCFAGPPEDPPPPGSRYRAGAPAAPRH